MKKIKFFPIILLACLLAAMLTVPAAALTEPETTPDPDAVVNLNTADEAALRTLDGIGEVLAQRILDYRAEHGPFQSVDELTNVKGIGSGILEANRERLTTGGTP